MRDYFFAAAYAALLIGVLVIGAMAWDIVVTTISVLIAAMISKGLVLTLKAIVQARKNQA